MRFAFSLSLAAIGVSFLLPSDGYKAALFVLCGALVFLFMQEPRLAMESTVAKEAESDSDHCDVDQADYDKADVRWREFYG
ncbi:hypothetical protein [Sinorhizobium meliloti]|uniref:hypothetical protein n=1 Tax=Rhizobium meliloti TaxID=382 RepID=UPI000FDA67D5|nr:hypothetical protein [Sinorhizobium meliloti]RVH50687.1 hypothetical protein CN212_10475 [Sinorhizobium meliloti]